MKFKTIFVFCIALLIANLPGMFGEDPIYQINNLDYSYSNGYGINQDVSYKINCDDDCILTIKEYEKTEEDAIKVKLSDKNMDTFVNMLNKYHVASWDGFSKSDKNVLDGDSFSFHLRFNDDERLSASGYMMYPENYNNFQKDFENYIESIKK